MTLRQLAERLAEVVEENERRDAARIARGLQPERRNDADVLVSVHRGGRKRPHYYPVNYVSSCLSGIHVSELDGNHERMDVFEILTNESSRLTTTTHSELERNSNAG